MADSSAINLSKNDIQRADNRDHVGHQMANAHLLQRLQINE